MICSDGTNGQAARALGISDECLQHSSGIYGAVAAIERPNQTLVPTPEKRVHNLTFDLSAYGNSSYDEDGKSNFSMKIFGNSKCRFIALAVNKCESKIVKALKTILDKSVSICYVHFKSFPLSHGRIQKGTWSPDPPPPLKNYKHIGFLSNTGPDPMKNHKATKPAFNVRPSSARQRNAI